MNFFFSETVFFHVIIRGLLLFQEVKGCGRWLPLAVKGWRSQLGLLWGGRPCSGPCCGAWLLCGEEGDHGRRPSPTACACGGIGKTPNSLFPLCTLCGAAAEPCCVLCRKYLHMLAQISCYCKHYLGVNHLPHDLLVVIF